MEIRESKSANEIWEAKEKLYEELKNVPVGKRVEFLQEKAKAAMDKFFKNKKVDSL
jgi:hypothetical protein